MASNNRILNIYKSRKTIIDILDKHLSYKVDDYLDFSINEIDAMNTNLQLDMLIEHKSEIGRAHV